MNTYSKLSDEFNKLTEIHTFTSNEFGDPVTILTTAQEWSIVAKVILNSMFVSGSKKINTLKAEFILETIASGSGPSFVVDEIELDPSKVEYEFEVSIGRGELREGLYRVVTIITGKYFDSASSLLAYDESNLIQIYEPN